MVDPGVDGNGELVELSSGVWGLIIFYHHSTCMLFYVKLIIKTT